MLSNKKVVHVVSFAVPFPPNYGGVIDVYYKIAKLKELGVSVILHAFTYGGRQQEDVSGICEKVYYYERKKSFLDQFSTMPFIVKSRDNKTLLSRLLQDDKPILFEGLHSTFFIQDPQLKQRARFLRMHNIESDYYFHLYKAEKRWLNKLFFLLESKKLKRYEKEVLQQSDTKILAISQKDQDYLQTAFGRSYFVGAFHSFDEVLSLTGKGDFAFYHGKLDVAENNEAALFLLQHVFNKINYPLIIAGSNPSKELLDIASTLPHVQIKSSLNTEEIHRLLREAQVNVLPTFQATGVKLKLLSALYSGRFCLVNKPMIAGTSLAQFCSVVNTPEEWVQALQQISEQSFTNEDVLFRKELDNSSFSNVANAKKLYALLFPSS
jgi:glycosyltransferase involved in cell wall biosynthesis